MKSKLGVMIWLGYLIWRSYDYGRSIMWFPTKITDGFFFPHYRINIGGSAFVGRDASRERLPPRIDARGAGEEVRKRPHPKAFGDFPLRIHVSPQRRQKRGSGQDVSGKSFLRVSGATWGFFHVVSDIFVLFVISVLQFKLIWGLFLRVACVAVPWLISTFLNTQIISWCRAFPMDWVS